MHIPSSLVLILRSLIVIFITAALSTLLLSCQTDHPWNGLIKVALVMPFTGYDSHTAEDVLAGARLALREWNDKGGVNGYRIELVALDDQNQAQAAARCAREIVLDGDVIGTIGHWSNASAVAAAGLYRQAHMPFLTFAPASPPASDGFSGLRLGPNDDQLASSILKAVPNASRGRVAVVVSLPRDQTGESELARAIAGQMPEHDPSLVTQLAVDGSRLDFGQLITQISASQIGVVVFQGDYRQAAALYAALHQRLPTARFVAVGSDTSDFARVGGSVLGGALYVSSWPVASSLGDASTAFQQEYQALRGTAPTGYAKVTHDAVSILLTAAERGVQIGGRPTRETTARELPTIREFTGVAGPLTFQKNGDLKSTPLVVYRIGADGWPGLALK